MLGELALDDLRGELTIVIEGPTESSASDSPSADEIDAELSRLLADGRSTRDAARELAARFGLARRDAYARALARAGAAD